MNQLFGLQHRGGLAPLRPFVTGTERVLVSRKVT